MPEYAVLGSLESESPLALPEIAEDFLGSVAGPPPGPEELASTLGPGLSSLAADKLLEVRRFSSWPAEWSQGAPIEGDVLGAAAAQAGAWGALDGESVLVGRITEAGWRWL